jgi:hypothetical protein
MIDNIQFFCGLRITSVTADKHYSRVLQDHEGEQTQAEEVTVCVEAWNHFTVLNILF